jgi:hypothetical protein
MAATPSPYRPRGPELIGADHTPRGAPRVYTPGPPAPELRLGMPPVHGPPPPYPPPPAAPLQGVGSGARAAAES